MIYTLAFRTSELPNHMPDYSLPDFHLELTVGDSISIAFLFQRMVAGRIDGRALSGSSVLWKAESTFGMSIDGAAVFPRPDEMINRYSGRIRISADAMLADLRRFRTPMGSFPVLWEQSKRFTTGRVSPDLLTPRIRPIPGRELSRRVTDAGADLGLCTI